MSDQGEGRDAAEGGSAEEMRRRFADAYQEYVRALQDVWNSDEVRRRSDDAVRALYAAAQDVYPAREVSRAVDEATQEYIRAVQKAWSGADPSALDPWTLAAVAQSLQSAAWAAAAWGAGQTQEGGAWGWWPQVGWTWGWSPWPQTA
jgi:hypothetical protein